MILFNSFTFFSLTSFKESEQLLIVDLFNVDIFFNTNNSTQNSLISLIGLHQPQFRIEIVFNDNFLFLWYWWWMIGSIGAFTLIVGDAGLIVLSFLYKEDYQWTFYFYYLIVFYLSGYSFGFGEQFQYLKKRTLCFTNFILWPYQIQ